MSRPPRPLIPDACYHVTARGNRKANIYLDDRDYLVWHDLVARTADRFGFVCHAYCQMPNHFHMLLETPMPNLSEGMHFLNCTYSQHFNVRHGLTGHVFQGRFHSVLLEEESHFLELLRYIALNPVRAGLVASAEDWRWSSYRATAGLVAAPEWLDTSTVRKRFHGTSDAERIQAFRDFVSAGIGLHSPLKPLPCLSWIAKRTGSKRLRKPCAQGCTALLTSQSISKFQRRRYKEYAQPKLRVKEEKMSTFVPDPGVDIFRGQA